MSFKDCDLCKKTSDNRHFSCPSRMSDGRHFTDYRPQCTLNNQIRAQNNNLSSYDYRMHLTKNAEKIMAGNRQNADAQNRCGPCVEPYYKGTMLPEKYIVNCDGEKCTTTLNDPNGLGHGRKYNDDQEKGGYEQWNQKKQDELANVPCCGKSSDNMGYYSIDKKIKNDSTRLTVPSGATPMSGGDMSNIQ